jgi:hypothetical protein
MTASNSTDIQLILENVRVSYLYAYRPFEGKKDDGSISKTFCAHPLLKPDDPQLQKVREAQRSVAKAAWGDTLVDSPVGQPDPNTGVVTMQKIPAWQAVLNELAGVDKLCLHHGSISKRGKPEYEGLFFVSANSSKMPGIFCEINGQNVDISNNPGHPQAPYGGAICDIMVSIYAQGPNGKPNKWGRRINAQFMGVKFKAHAPAFGGGKIARADEFGVSGAGADAPMPAAAGPGSDLV